MVSTHGRFVWYELMTTDTQAAKAFYGKVLGLGTQDVSKPGMAYTLFSDGSIEADLPQGKLRFGSITELRDHIEQSA